eukprot:13785059-Ditylum_brightwellii.AAC.1
MKMTPVTMMLLLHVSLMLLLLTTSVTTHHLMTYPVKLICAKAIMGSPTKKRRHVPAYVH